MSRVSRNEYLYALGRTWHTTIFSRSYASECRKPRRIHRLASRARDLGLRDYKPRGKKRKKDGESV